MSKIYSSKSVVGFCFFAFIVNFILHCLAIGFLVVSIIEGNLSNAVILIVAFIIVFWPLLALTFYSLNREGCKIYYDDTTKTIYREGFICGYKRELKVSDIKEVTVIEIMRDDSYYVLVDDAHSKFTGFSKEAYLKFSKTDTNKKFLRQFWDKPITKIEKPFHPLQ